MGLDALKARVCAANIALVRRGLVVQTWGNASAIDREHGVVIIKPSGVPYDDLTPEQMCVAGLDGLPVGTTSLRPSVDLPTHLALYKAFPAVAGIVHTHSHYATCWAQARRPIPCLGTTHADYFNGEVPLAAPLDDSDVEDYEQGTGNRLIACVGGRNALHHPAALAAGHGPFTWGRDVESALEHAVVLEEVARMAFHTLLIDAAAPPLELHVLEKHFQRKHGSGAYYGQG